MSTVEIAGLTFYGSTHPGQLHVRRLIDWDSLPEMKNRPAPRPQDHGDFRNSRDLRSSVVPSIEGWYQGSDRADALRMRQRMTGALAGADLALTVTDELGPTSRQVSVRNASLKDIIGDRFEFAIDMLAPDPRRYGPTTAVQTGLPVSGGGITYPIAYPIDYGAPGSLGRAEVSNVGTTDTLPTFEITGGLAGGFSLICVETGQEIRFERQIPVGSTVYVIPRTGRAYIDDPANDVSGYLTRSDWWTIPAASTRTTQFNAIGAATGTPTLTVRSAPAYW